MTDDRNAEGNYMIGDIMEMDLGRLDFEEEWGDPLESDHSALDSVPERAVIDFGNGVVQEAGYSYLIKRAMLDPDATANPDDV